MTVEQFPVVVHVVVLPVFNSENDLRQVVSPLQGKRWTNSWRVNYLLLTLTLGQPYSVGGDCYKYLQECFLHQNLPVLADEITNIVRLLN